MSSHPVRTPAKSPGLAGRIERLSVHEPDAQALAVKP